MFRSCSISLREGTSPVHAPAPSGPRGPSASAPDMPRARERPCSHRPEARCCALGCCQPPGRSRGEAGRWAVAGAGQQLPPSSHAAPALRRPPSPLPRAGHSPVHCPDRHSQLKQTHVPNRALLGPYWFQSAPQALSPEPHCSATEQPCVAAAPCPQDAHHDMAGTVLSGVLNAAAAVSEIWLFITSN